MNGGESIAVLSRSAKTFWTVRGHLDSALFGTQTRTTRVVRFVFKTNQKKNQRRDKKCRSTELDMTCKNESVNLVVRGRSAARQEDLRHWPQEKCNYVAT